MIEAVRASVHLRVVHPNWLGRVVYGTIVHVPNRWHADINTNHHGVLRCAQASLIWAQDWEKQKRAAAP